MPGFMWGCLEIDGRDWFPVVIDAAGHLQIDVLTMPEVEVGEVPYTTLTTDDGSSRVEYVGWALPGTATSAETWRIAKLSYTAGGNPLLKWADGVATFTKEWDEKATYTYS